MYITARIDDCVDSWLSSIFVPNATDRIADDDLINYVAEVLSVHKRPREIRWVDALPRNAMGKVVKTALT